MTSHVVRGNEQLAGTRDKKTRNKAVHMIKPQSQLAGHPKLTSRPDKKSPTVIPYI